MEQQIRFCHSADGTRIAYAVLGSGPPVIMVPPWVTHLELSWEIPGFRESLERRARDFTVVRMEKRGNGLSDRDCTDFSLASRLADLEAVIDDLKLKRFALLGYSEGGPTSVAYAAKYPRRVSRLLLDGTWARGAGMFGTRELQSAAMALVQAEWGVGASMLTELFMGGDAPPEMRQMFARIQQIGCSKQDAYNSMIANFSLDIRDLLPKVRCPTLIVHARGDRIVPLELGRELAAGIPGARFVSREGSHVPTTPDQQEELTRITDEFLAGDLPGAERRSAAPAAASQQSLRTILFTDVVGNTELLARVGDAGWREHLREHERITRQALAAHDGDEVKAMGDGFMASFASTMRAMDCAIALQRAFAERNASSDAPLLVRVGLNAGEPIAEDDDLFGTSVTTAARVMSQAQGGEIVVTNVVRELCAGKGYLFADRGITALKGFEEPVRLYELKWDETP